MTEAKTPTEFFEKMLPVRFKPEKAAGIDVVAQLNLTDAKGGKGCDWVVTIKDQKLQVREGTTTKPTITLKLTENDFMNIVNDKLSTEKAFFTGKLHFEGNLSLALKLRDAGIL
jgi:putative sterol carrier protein